MTISRMTDFDLSGKRLLIREDFNVPLKDGHIESDARLRASIPTLTYALDAGASVLAISHLGRPTPGQVDPSFSLAPVADWFSNALGKKVMLNRDWIDGVDLKPGVLVIGENVRFLSGEREDDEVLARKMARLCDIYVMDAFGTAHRCEASTHGVAKYATVACGGPLLMKELDALARVMTNPERPLVVIAGGSKVSTKLDLLDNLAPLADHVIVGGGIANTFLSAAGYPVGNSIHEPSMKELAKAIQRKVQSRGGQIPLPTDVVVAKRPTIDAVSRTCDVSDIADDEMILDIGPKTAKHLAELLKASGTIIWNGPMGVFELDPFAEGTRRIAEAVAESNAYSLAGGGETMSAIQKFKVESRISYISTGGGAFLEYLEGKQLPAVAALEARALDGSHGKR